jgi:hypothetical protein
MINGELRDWRYRRANKPTSPMSPSHSHGDSKEMKGLNRESSDTSILDANGIKRILSQPDIKLVYGADKQLLCERHYQDRYAAKCYQCQQAIAGGAVQAGDHVYHANCVTCSICEVILGDEVDAVYRLDQSNICCR